MREGRKLQRWLMEQGISDADAGVVRDKSSFTRRPDGQGMG